MFYTVLAVAAIVIAPTPLDAEIEEYLSAREVLHEFVVEVVRPDPELRLSRVAEPPPPPPPPPPPVSTPVTGWSYNWDALAQCESNGDWSINTGNGFYGGLQFHLDTWAAVKPPGAPAYPHLASKAVQIQAAENLLAVSWGGLHHWPACTRALGWR